MELQSTYEFYVHEVIQMAQNKLDEYQKEWDEMVEDTIQSAMTYNAFFFTFKRTREEAIQHVKEYYWWWGSLDTPVWSRYDHVANILESAKAITKTSSYSENAKMTLTLVDYGAIKSDGKL